MANETTLEITENITKVEVTEDVTSINITPNITTVELKGISISNAGSASAMTYEGQNNDLGEGSTVAEALDHINTNGLNKNMDQTIDGDITFTDGHTLTFPESGYTALELNDNSMNLAGITASEDITSATKMEAPLFKGDLEGAVHFKATDSGTTLAKGDVVYITGYEGNKTTVDKADASDSAKMPAFGIVNSVTGSNVDVLTFGSMLHLSTTGIATGTELYVSATTPGGYETSAPTGEGNLVQKIAKVVRGDSNSGSIKIMGAGRTNATPNLNDGNIFIGNSSNIPTTASFDTTFASSFATRTTDNLTEGDNLYYTDDRVNTKLGSGVDNIVTTGYLRGPSTFTIDPAGHGDISGKVVIAGDLQVDGTTTTINSQNLTVDDLAITVASGAPNSDAANGAGIVVDGANASFTYSNTTDAWYSNKNLYASGNVSFTGTYSDSSGNVGTNGQALFSTGTGTEWANINETLTVRGDVNNAQSIILRGESLEIAGGDHITTTMSTNTVTIDLDNSDVSPGTYGAAQTIPQITINDKGIVTNVTEISGQVGPSGPAGPTGSQGVRGANGANTLEYLFNTDTSMVSPLSSGRVQLNKLNYTHSGLRLRISSYDKDSTDVKDFIRFLTSSTNPDIKGHITLTNQEEPSRFLLLEINNEEYVTSDDNETLVSVARVAGIGGGSNIQDGLVGFTNNPTILVSFLKAADFGQFDSIQDLPDVSSNIPPINGSILSYSSAGGEYRPDLVENFAKIEEQYIKVSTGAGIFKGFPYGQTAFDSTNNLPIVGLTDASNDQLCLGIAYENAGNGQVAKLLTRGILTGVDTSTTRIPGTGNFVYISELTGGLTRTPPVVNQVTTQQVGYIFKTSVSGVADGVMYVDIGSKAIGVSELQQDEFAIGGANGEQKASYLDRALPIMAPFGLSPRTYRNVLTAVDQQGFNIHQFGAADITRLNIGDKNNSDLDELNLYPGTAGKCQLHFGRQVNPTLNTLEESQRLHTTSNGIHVGNNLQDGSYTAGDMHVNNDTGYGMVIGQSITNAGHNCFLVGQEHNISADSANFMGVGYDIDTTDAVHQSLGVGTHIDFIGGGTEATRHWGMLGVGRYVSVEENFAVALGYGTSTDYMTASGTASFAQGYRSQATGNYSIAMGGSQFRDGSPVEPEASGLGSMTMGPNTISGTHSLGVGKFNTVAGDNCAAAIGSYNTASGDKSITLGEGNLTRDTSGSLSQVAIGTSHELYGDSCVAIGKYCFTPTAIGNVAAGLGVKASQRNIAGYPAQGDGQVVVGAYNNNLQEWASDDYTNDIVAPLHFSVGTGSADGSRYTSIAVGPKSPSSTTAGSSSTGEAGFCGIVMQALKDSPSYTDAEASHANSHVPIGGLYRTGNIVKIRLA